MTTSSKSHPRSQATTQDKKVLELDFHSKTYPSKFMSLKLHTEQKSTAAHRTNATSSNLGRVNAIRNMLFAKAAEAAKDTEDTEAAEA